MTVENAIFLALVFWKIAQWLVPCIALSLLATWLLEKGGKL
jgi:hypothetical protein